MTPTPPNQSDRTEENRQLRGAIAEAGQHLDSAAARLREVLEEEALVEATPMEVEAAMVSASEAIEAASSSLKQSTATCLASSIRPIPGGPTRQQGKFLAFIREYMRRNHGGVAPTHAELQRFFNLTPPSINSMLKRLDEKGFIRRTPGKARAIELTISPELIPPLGQFFKQ